MAPRRKRQKRKQYQDASDASINREESATNASGRNFIDTLPDELLSKIFRMCVMGTDGSHKQPHIALSKQCTFFLCRVSKRWNGIALADSALWTIFRMKLDQGGNLNRSVKALQTMQIRAGTRQLSIAVDGAHEDTRIASSNYAAFVEVLLDCTNRLSSIEIQLPGDCHVRHLLNSLALVGTPTLSRLSISYKFNHSVGHMRGCNCSRLSNIDRISFDLSNAPLLKDLSVSVFRFSLRESKLTSKNLVKFRWRSKLSLSTSQIIDILESAPLLQELRVNCRDGTPGGGGLPHEAQPVATRRVYLNHLTHISLHYWSIDSLKKFLEVVETPALKVLAVYRTSFLVAAEMPHWNDDTFFFGYTRVPSLHTLVIADPNILSRLQAILREQPLLRNFSLRSFKRSYGIIDALKCVSLDGASSICPVLERLDFMLRMTDDTIATSVLEMALFRARTRPDGDANTKKSLTEFNLTLYPGDVGDKLRPDVAARLKATIANGFKFTLMTEGAPEWVADALS